MLNETPFADVHRTPDGLSLPELKWRELLFTGALRAEGEFYVRDPTRPLSPFEMSDPFPVGVRFRARRDERDAGGGPRVICTPVDPEPPATPVPAPVAATAPAGETVPPPAAAVFTPAGMEDEPKRAARRYLEFLRVPALSAGIYRLAVGAEDPQPPHAEDEIYVVLSGRARLTLGGQEREVEPGTLVYVPARLPHRFHSIAEALSLLVIFAPAEGTSEP